MIREHRSHLHRTEIELHIVEFLKGEMRRHLVQPDGKERALHLLEKRAAQSVHCAFVTEDAHVDLRMISRDEKREALDVVPMRVRDEHVHVQSMLVDLSHERLPEAWRKSCS